MSKLRIHELAKELGVDNKILIDKANSLGFNKKSHSNTLSDEEIKELRTAFSDDTPIRDDIFNFDEPLESILDTPKQKKAVVKRNVVEKRSANVIRRKKVDDQFFEVRKEEENIIQEPDQAIEQVEAKEIVENTNENVEIKTSSYNQNEVVNEETPQEQTISDSPPTNNKPIVGPRVLGKINIEINPQRQRAPFQQKDNKPSFNSEKTPKSIFDFKINKIEINDDETEELKDKKKGRKGRIVEFSSRDLVDYDSKKRRKRSGGSEHDQDSELGKEQQRPYASGSIEVTKKPVKMTSDFIVIADLANQMGLKAGQVISKLIQLGVMATVNQRIDKDTATIIAEEFGYQMEFSGFEETSMINIEGMNDPESQLPRPPVVTVMGHVDHGKTSLLDFIRSATVADKEHGGITQHIGAYTVETKGHKKITFIDTPGHSAFTAMRARGAKITDIVILVVAADDGVMPQTLEALSHAKEAKVPIIVAVNKIDKPDANPDRVKTQLAEYGLQPEEWGGDTIFAPVSALKGTGVEELLESILLVAEVAELKANPNCRAKGTIIEVRQEQGRGTVATVLVQAGTLKKGENFLSGANYGKIRSMKDFKGMDIAEALPSTPVEITGFDSSPEAGNDFVIMQSDMEAKQVANYRKLKLMEEQHLALSGGPISLEEFAKRAAAQEKLELKVILKADVHGSIEAVKKSVEDLSREEVSVKVIHQAVGGINDSDLQLAIASKAIIVGFNVRGEPKILQSAEEQNVEIRFYRIIYELIDDIKKSMSGLLAPIKEEENIASVEVRETFTIPKAGTIAGCYVTNGKVERGANVRLLRDSRVIYEGKMQTLRRFKEDVKEVASGYECGMGIEGFNDIKVGDVIEVYKIKEVQRTLD